jgi:hypothetical protein
MAELHASGVIKAKLRETFRLLCYCLLGLSFHSVGSWGAEAPHASQKPSVMIPLEQLGYHRPGDVYLSMRYSLVSLDFLDATHLLFTFQKKALLTRETNPQPGDDDQLIHAAVVEIPTGNEVASADWRMHDHDRYLWPLGKGVFLVRQANAVFRTNASLQLVPYGHFPGNEVEIQISPEGSLLVAQTREPQEGQAQAAPVDSLTSEFLASTSKPIVVRIVRVSDGKLIGQTRARSLVSLPLNTDGFAEVLEGKPDNWAINFAPMTSASNPEKPRPLAEVSSTCRPSVLFLNHETLMAVRCGKSREHSALALDLKGNRLWEHEVDSNHIWPTIARSEDGSRFAQGILKVGGYFSVSNVPGTSDIQGQTVEVFDTVSGKLLMSSPATPVYDAGQNFALSADGKKFAILHDGTIEIYDLP